MISVKHTGQPNQQQPVANHYRVLHRSSQVLCQQLSGGGGGGAHWSTKWSHHHQTAVHGRNRARARTPQLTFSMTGPSAIPSVFFVVVCLFPTWRVAERCLLGNGSDATFIRADHSTEPSNEQLHQSTLWHGVWQFKYFFVNKFHFLILSHLKFKILSIVNMKVSIDS